MGIDDDDKPVYADDPFVTIGIINYGTTIGLGILCDDENAARTAYDALVDGAASTHDQVELTISAGSARFDFVGRLELIAPPRAASSELPPLPPPRYPSVSPPKYRGSMSYYERAIEWWADQLAKLGSKTDV